MLIADGEPCFFEGYRTQSDVVDHFELTRFRVRAISQVTVWKRCDYGAGRVASRLCNRFGHPSRKVFRTAIQFGRILWLRKYPLKPNIGEIALKPFAFFGITVAASAGLCGAALTFSPDASAAPRPMGGGACVAPGGAPCVVPMSGLAAPAAPVVLPGPPADAVPVPAAVPPVLAGVPAGGPVLGAPAPVGAPLALQSGTGKGVPTNPSLAADPVVRPGPPPAPTPPPPAPASHPTLVTAIGPADAGSNP